MSGRVKCKCIVVDPGSNESSIQLETISNEDGRSLTGIITIDAGPDDHKEFEVGKEYYVEFAPVPA